MHRFFCKNPTLPKPVWLRANSIAVRLQQGRKSLPDREAIREGEGGFKGRPPTSGPPAGLDPTTY